MTDDDAPIPLAPGVSITPPDDEPRIYGDGGDDLSFIVQLDYLQRSAGRPPAPDDGGPERTANGVLPDLSNADWPATLAAWKSEKLAAASLAEARAEYWRLDAEVAAEREARRTAAEPDDEPDDGTDAPF